MDKAVKFRYVGAPCLTRGDYGDSVRVLYRVSWGYDEEREEMGWVLDPDGQDYKVWDSDFGWLHFGVTSEEVGDPIG